jgi:hypothetical protein
VYELALTDSQTGTLSSGLFGEAVELFSYFYSAKDRPSAITVRPGGAIRISKLGPEELR